jgi:hypothetical protein
LLYIIRHGGGPAPAAAAAALVVAPALAEIPNPEIPNPKKIPNPEIPKFQRAAAARRRRRQREGGMMSGISGTGNTRCFIYIVCGGVERMRAKKGNVSLRKSLR